VDFECVPDAEEPLFRINSPVAPDMQYLITVVSKHGCPIRDADSCVLKDASGGAPIFTIFKSSDTIDLLVIIVTDQ
jgi:hypothetical protein